MSESDSTVLVAAVKLLCWSMVKKNCFKPTLMTFHQRKCRKTDRAMMQQTDRSCKNKWFMMHAHDSMWAHWTSAAATSPTDMYHGFWQHFVLSQPLNHTHTYASHRKLFTWIIHVYIVITSIWRRTTRITFYETPSKSSLHISYEDSSTPLTLISYILHK